MMLNQKPITLKMKRIDVCDLLIACTEAQRASGAHKWEVLHDMLKEQLDAFDEKNDAE